MTRTTVSLDGTWEFWPDSELQFSPATLEEAPPPRPIKVPGPWQAQFHDLRDYTGVGWYRKRFQLADFRVQADLEKGQSLIPHPQSHIYLCFGAVDYHTTVWLNGEQLGQHEGGYLPFEFCLGEALRPDGDNEIIVRVIDPGDDSSLFPQFPFAEIPHGKQSWYGPIGGIWQSVRLEERAVTHIRRLQLTPDVPGSQVHVLVQLNQPAPEGFLLELHVTDPQGAETTHRFTINVGEERAEHSLTINNPLLWDTREPNLYHVAAQLRGEPGQAATMVDSYTSHFGMRTITTSPDGHLVLNGRVLYLRGALDQDYYPEGIYTPFSDAEIEDQFAKARHMGLNCLRTHIKITDPRYYDLADRAGLLIWTELPNWEELTQGARRRARDTLKGMVERDWNHPSIIIWTIINEGWGVELAVNADHRQWLAETYAYLKNLDPHRLVVGNSPCFSTFHVVTDIEDFHNYYAIPDHYRQWREWVQIFASRPPWTFAHAYDRYEDWRQYQRDPWNPLPRTAAPEVVRRGNEPMVVSEFGNWGLPDVNKLYECYGGEPWWFETGQEWGEGVVYPHGIEQRFRLYHLHRVFPTLADLATATQRMQFTALKYQIETMRRFPNIVGYIITEFTDVHWECNGLLDQCRNPKAFHDVIANVNSADAMVPDWDRVVFWEGERCEVRLALSHFSAADLRGCRIEWQVDLWPELQGSFEGIMAELGQVINVGTVVFEVPELERSARARLEMRLFDMAGNEVSYNHHEIYVFPRRLAQPTNGPDGPLLMYAEGVLAERLTTMGYRVTGNLSESRMAVVETMTDELRAYLQRGGRVLWLAESSDGGQTYLGSIKIAQRKGRSWQGDWANSMSWLKQDGLFREIPTGNLVDFAFADLTPDAVIVGMRPRDFASDVHAGLFVGWLHHTVALIAERRFEEGLLLTCTFRLRDQLPHNPVATVMLHDMLRHLAFRLLSVPM